MNDLQSIQRKKRGRPKKAPSTAKTAVGYIRVSTEEQQNGPEAQRADIERYAASQGLTVVSWHADLGISGATPLDKRPALIDALESVRASRAGILVVAKRDRLARDSFLCALIERMAKAAGANIQSADGRGNGDTAEDQVLRGMLDLFAQYERALIKMRTKAALAAKKSRGEALGEQPYGFRVASDGKMLEPDPAEQEVITWVHGQYRAGVGISEITRQLNARGTQPRGAKWGRTTVHRIVSRIRGANGELLPRGEEGQ
jgi:DNA invertase Pin-like site-specific DNA recombinase